MAEPLQLIGNVDDAGYHLQHGEQPAMYAAAKLAANHYAVVAAVDNTEV